MLVIENIMTHAAEVLGMDPWVLRAKNLTATRRFEMQHLSVSQLPRKKIESQGS